MKTIFLSFCLVGMTFFSNAQTTYEVVTKIYPPNPDPSGIAVSSENRVFLGFPRHADNHKEFALAELVNDQLIPFPSKEYVYPGTKPYKDWLVSPHGMYIDKNDVLWVLDDGKRSGIKEIPEGAAKVVAIDINTKKILHSVIIPKPVLADDAHYNDLRVDLSHGKSGTVYIANSGFGLESGLRDRSAKGEIEGARIHSAGYGFGVANGAPPLEFAMDKVFRPTSVAQVPAEMDSLVKVHPELVKIWVDDFNGKYKIKIKPEIYKAIIEEAHKRNLRVAAHVYYLSDLKKLVADGIDIIGHSIRSEVIDDATLAQMKAKGIVYIPTLSLDEFAFIYAKKPEWINDPFFKNSLEPGVYEMITSEKYQNDLKNSPNFTKNMKAFEIAKQNLKKVFDAGILVAMGTDSGAMPLRAQGFSEHLELQLMTEAGLTPIQALTVATKNSAKALKIDKDFGTLEAGKTADFIVVDGNPAKNIMDTRKIFSVYKAGKEVSKGAFTK